MIFAIRLKHTEGLGGMVFKKWHAHFNIYFPESNLIER